MDERSQGAEGAEGKEAEIQKDFLNSSYRQLYLTTRHHHHHHHRPPPPPTDNIEQACFTESDRVTWRSETLLTQKIQTLSKNVRTSLTLRDQRRWSTLEAQVKKKKKSGVSEGVTNWRKLKVTPVSSFSFIFQSVSPLPPSAPFIPSHSLLSLLVSRLTLMSMVTEGELIWGMEGTMGVSKQVSGQSGRGCLTLLTRDLNPPATNYRAAASALLKTRIWRQDAL